MHRTVSPLARALAALLALLALGAAPAHAAKPHYQVKPGVRLSPPVEAKIAAIADRYYATTRRPLLITSGTRSPREQAAAMYGKLKAGDRLYLYRMQGAVAPLRAAYDRGRRKRAKPDAIIAEMARILADQVERGVFLSRHLRAFAFDVRSYDLTVRQRRAFFAAVGAVGGVTVLEERKPPHFHCEVRPTPSAAEPVTDLGPDPGDGDDDGAPPGPAGAASAAAGGAEASVPPADATAADPDASDASTASDASAASDAPAAPDPARRP